MKTMCVRVYKLNLSGRPKDEVFAEIEGYSRYLASNYGEIYDKQNGRLISQTCVKYNGRSKLRANVSMVNDAGQKKTVTPARMILTAFDPQDSYDKLEVNHINLDPTCNYLSNLEWLNHLDNVQDYYRKTNADVIYTDEMVHMICQCLMQSMRFEDIASILGIQYTNAVKVYITAIRTRKIRVDISSKYDFPNKVRNTAEFTDDEIHFICQCFIQGLTSQEILPLVNRDYPKGSTERLHVLEILNRIKSKKRFTRISDLYFKDPILK